VSILPPEVSQCCPAPRLVPAIPREVKVGGNAGSVRPISGLVCLGCGSTDNASGLPFVLSPDELAAWQVRWAARDAARAAVAAGIPVTSTDTAATFPKPLWLPAMGMCTALTHGALFSFEDAPRLRAELRKIYGSGDDEAPISIETAVGPVVIDRVYYDHLYEVDSATGRDRIDADHVAHAPLTVRTMNEPLEVYLQQTGGRKTRKIVFLALYQIDSAFTYHMVVVKEMGRRLITSFRVNGGRVAFERHRFGVPLYVRY
jgi:hypothetical protein